jgi:hypothetical protein
MPSPAKPRGKAPGKGPLCVKLLGCSKAPGKVGAKASDSVKAAAAGAKAPEAHSRAHSAAAVWLIAVGVAVSLGCATHLLSIYLPVQLSAACLARDGEP